MFKDVYKNVNNKIPINPELLEKTKNRVNHQTTKTLAKHNFFQNHKFIAIPTFLIIILCIVLIKPFIIKKTIPIDKPNTTVNPPINQENAQLGVMMHNLYRYNGNYYNLKNTSPDIQKNISKRLSDEFYEIKDVSPSKSIAIFANGYYYLLDFAYKDTVFFNNKPYLITRGPYMPNHPVNNSPPGKHLGKVDGYDIYEISGSDTSKEIYVRIGTDYFVAYQYLSSVKLQGINYELSTEKNPINNSNAEEYIGMAGPYKAYKYNNNDITNSIIIHINDSEEVIAKTTTVTDKSPIPVSRYGSDEESMYPMFASITWRMHGVYSLDGKTNHKPIKDLVGNKLDTIKEDNYSYELYETKGEPTTKSIMVKNNKVYIKYDFMFGDTIKFNGHDYIFGDWKPNYVKGNQIGTFGINKIYEIKGEDPLKVIDVFMSSSPDNTGLRCDFAAYRQDD